MKYFILRERSDYADEFDIEAVDTAIAESADEAKLQAVLYCLEAESREEADKYFEVHGTREFYFGTNEYIDFSSVDEMLESLSATEITEEEFEVFNKICGQAGLGVILR